MYTPVFFGSSLQSFPANNAAFCFISGLLSAIARASISEIVDMWGTKLNLSLVKQTSSRSISCTLTSSAVTKLSHPELTLLRVWDFVHSVSDSGQKNVRLLFKTHSFDCPAEMGKGLVDWTYLLSI